MAEGLNRVMLFGNLGADPELRTTQTGTSVLKLRLATTERYLDANKTWQDRTEWHRVVVWGKRGEALHRIIAKGSTIFVEGSLRTSSYEKDGVKMYSTEVVAQNVLLGGRGRAGGAQPSDDFDAPRQAPQPQRGGAPQPQSRAGGSSGGPPGGAPQDAPPDDFGYGAGGDDDIPF